MNEFAPASQHTAPSAAARLRGGVRAVLRHALDAALPPLCPSCHEPLGDGAGLCAGWGVPVLHDALKRVRATPQQVGLSKTERADNVQGTFRVLDKSAIAGRRLVLIDDVLTSGATADTCAKALLRAGAAHVDVLVFTRVVAPVRTTI